MFINFRRVVINSIVFNGPAMNSNWFHRFLYSYLRCSLICCCFALSCSCLTHSLVWRIETTNNHSWVWRIYNGTHTHTHTSIHTHTHSHILTHTQTNKHICMLANWRTTQIQVHWFDLPSWISLHDCVRVLRLVDAVALILLAYTFRHSYVHVYALVT